MAELQRLVEDLGQRLSRSIALDDTDLRLLAYSSHAGEVDPARTTSILKRKVSRSVVDYVREKGARGTDNFFTIPARPDLGIEIARIGVPVKYRGALLGFMWLLTSEGAVDDLQASAVRRAAETVGLIIHREYLLGELSRGRERELTRDLLADQAEVRAQAAEQLVAENLFSHRASAALVVTLTRGNSPLTEQDRLALTAGVEFGRSRREQRRALTLERPDHAILLLTDDHPTKRGALAELGTGIRERVLAEADSHTCCWIGIGEPRTRLEDVHASYADARRAAEVASVVRVLGFVVRYSELGVYSMLAELPPDRLADSLHPGLRALFERPRPGEDDLVFTLEAFFDNAGNIKRTSEQLRIHRTSLYYRLKRVEEITGVDLSRGDDRLSLHLGLKIARLIAMH
ncbi:helix-turn-helix domain-containing protein [Streptomyces oryzae]|uniref:Helix-turn-helix domain-containing protein n=2 Tax=Streptomyces oryzae TaxID=1434886 RepID=A0ABS3XAS6_9ACTN|nr:helix-turn-helix domain-containing protein [Streptomyces oryzae]